MKLEIKNCWSCPFANNDNEYGRDCCNLAKHLDKNIKLKEYEQLPHDTRHKDCPIENKLEITVIEDYLKVLISVLRYIPELEQQQHSKNDMINFAWWLTRNLGQFSDDKDAHFKGKYFDMWAKEIKKELS